MTPLRLLVASVSARSFAPQDLPYAQPSPQVQPRPALRASTPTMIVTPDLASAPVVLPTIMTIADSGAITDGQIFTALAVALVAAFGAINLGINLYK